MDLFKSAILVLISLSSCSENVSSMQDEHNLMVYPQTIYQEIDHFGASDAWSGQFVGHWPEQKKGAIADLLFSKDMDDTKGFPLF